MLAAKVQNHYTGFPATSPFLRGSCKLDANLASSLYSGIWETTRHNRVSRHNGLFPCQGGDFSVTIRNRNDKTAA